jgi:hypothetical protein
VLPEKQKLAAPRRRRVRAAAAAGISLEEYGSNPWRSKDRTGGPCHSVLFCERDCVAHGRISQPGLGSLMLTASHIRRENGSAFTFILSNAEQCCDCDAGLTIM